MADSLEGEMLLVGRYLSPFVRRVAVTLQHFGMPYRRQVLSILTDMPEIEKSNPVGRVPVLVLSSGESLVRRQPHSAAGHHGGLAFIRRVHPGLVGEGELPALSRLTARCEAMPAFRAAWIDIEA